jgi:hypothetical protein
LLHRKHHLMFVKHQNVLQRSFPAGNHSPRLKLTGIEEAALGGFLFFALLVGELD